MPPSDKMNLSKYQFEYDVSLNTSVFSHASVKNAVLMDRNGFIDNYEDMVLAVGSIVLVMFIGDKRTAPVIVGGIRHYLKPMQVSDKLNQIWKKRYNKFELSIDDSFNFMAKSDSGPYLSVNVDKIVLAALTTTDDSGESSGGDDSEKPQVEENLILDKNSKTITINTKDIVTNVKNESKTTIDKNATIEVKENVTITIKGNVTLTVEGDVELKCKNLKAEVQETAEVNAKKTVKIKSKKIELNGGGTGVTTAASHQNVIDLITGVPCIPSVTIIGDK